MRIAISFLVMVIMLLHGVSAAREFSRNVVTGAEQMDLYLPMLKNKKIALLVNQTSRVGKTHLVDTLLASGIEISTIFAPEHGFRGVADAGEKVKSSVDPATGITLTSMYGASKKPSSKSLQGVDLVVFDIQDVGARFYTYISSLQYMMEACALNGIPMLILDRPNPNGFYVDGPVLEDRFRSFVGMQAIPIVHGMTVAEYALMLNGEGWLEGKRKCEIQVIPCKNYDHTVLYRLPVPPSPNLRSASSIFLYPSLCLFEGTEVSVGRGTPMPFEVWGHPSYRDNGFSFVPKSSEGARRPLYEDQRCYGANLSLPPYDVLKITGNTLNLDFIRNAYSLSPDKEKFFNDFFEKLAGTAALREQIMKGLTAAEIRATWQAGISAFKNIRSKYLLYKDFE